MFIQVIKGRVRDAAEVRRVFDRWYDELSPGAAGWLGSTAGVADDGTFVATARFESEEAARRNSERPEQGEWWSEASGVFSGPVEFHDCAEVAVGRGGGSDRAGFVQVIEGRSTDLARSRELAREWDRIVQGRRPELLGTVIALHGEDGRFTQLAYFTSEAEARVGERDQSPPPPELVEARSLLEDVTFLDLRDPWLRSPR